MKPILRSPIFRKHSLRTIRRASRFVWTMGISGCLQTWTGTTATAQPAEGIPAPSNVGQSGYPRILPDNRVVFQVRAPIAGQVQINLGRNHDMTKDDADFKAHGLNVEFASFPGGHEWQVWRKSLHDFAQRIF